MKKNKIVFISVFSLGFIFFLSVFVFADASAKSGGTFASDSSNSGDNAWTNPSRASASDNSYATSAIDPINMNGWSQYLTVTNFGFAIPDGATIDGIQVNVERKSSTYTAGTKYAQDDTVQLLKAGTAVGSNLATTTPYTTSDVQELHGGTTNKWGTTWTPADINNANFGVIYSAKTISTNAVAQTISVDWIGITVYYTPAAPPADACATTTDGSNWSIPCGCNITRVQTRVDYFTATGTGTLSIDSSNITYSRLNFTPTQCAIALNGSFVWAWKP